jgi:hypothetical protein
LFPHLPIESLFKGHNLAVTSYGVSGSGKTHTIFGSKQELGLAQYLVHSIFKLMDTQNYNLEPEIFCSFVEISGTKTTQSIAKDLLGSQPIKIRHAYETEIRDLNLKKITTPTAFDTQLSNATAARKTQPTKQNPTGSSRSHMITMIQVKMNDTIGRLFVTDLAGSEKHFDQNSAFINHSLGHLRTYLEDLQDSSRTITRFRGSILTEILSLVLNNMSYSVFMVHISNVKDFDLSFQFIEKLCQIVSVAVSKKPKPLIQKSKMESLSDPKGMFLFVLLIFL